MRRNRASVLILALLMLSVLLPGCGKDNSAANEPQISQEESAASIDDTAAPISEDAPERAVHDETSNSFKDPDEGNAILIGDTETDAAENAFHTETADVSSANGEMDSVPDSTRENTLYLQIGDQILTASLVENSSTAALKELLGSGPVTIDMRDYGNFEKVGELGTTLPANDISITTEPGDLILYQGSSFVIYYGPNSWSFTRLGKINGVTGEELKEILGSGSVSVTLSLN